jgi:hypothetical protein
VTHRVTNVGNEAIREEREAAAAGYEGAGHGEQARRLRQEARILNSVPDPGTRG